MTGTRKIYLFFLILTILFFSSACFLGRCSALLNGKAGEITNRDDYVQDLVSSAIESGSPETAPENASANAGNVSHDTRQVNLDVSYLFTLKGKNSKIEFLSTIPGDYIYRQKIKSASYSIEPSEIFMENGNSYASFVIMNPGQDFVLNMDFKIELLDFDLAIARILFQDNEISDNKDKSGMEKYLGSEKNIDCQDPGILEAVRQLKNPDQMAEVHDIYSFVLENMSYYGYNPQNVGAVGGLAAGGGDCTEYSDLFAALCRGAGIPARVVEGYDIKASSDQLSMGHNWSEIYLDQYGWVPFDTIFDDNNGNSADSTFDNLENVYVYFSFERNDPVLSGFHYYYYSYFGDEVLVNKQISVNLN